MRILVVVHGYPPTHSGGAELRAARSAKGLAALGHDVSVLCIESIDEPVALDNGGYTHADREQDGVWVRRLSFRFQTGADSFKQSYENPYVGRALQQLLDERSFDLIHVFSGYLLGSVVVETAAARKIPLVVSLTDFWWLCHRVNLVKPNGMRCAGPAPAECARCHMEARRKVQMAIKLSEPLADGLWRVAQGIPALRGALGIDEQEERYAATMGALRKVDYLISPSQHLADTYADYGVARERIRVWRQGVDVELCPLRVRSQTLRFGYMGQIKEHKGVHNLIEAWGKLQGTRECSLTLYGSDAGAEAYGAGLRRQSAEMRNVTWAGRIGREAVWQALAQMDVLVIPSTWRENSPNVILEAQAMGVAVVGANVEGVAEMVHHEENGLLFDPDSSGDLAAQLQRLCDEPALLHHLHTHLLPFHSFRAEMQNLEALYLQLAAAGQGMPIPVVGTGVVGTGVVGTGVPVTAPAVGVEQVSVQQGTAQPSNLQPVNRQSLTYKPNAIQSVQGSAPGGLAR